MSKKGLLKLVILFSNFLLALAEQLATLAALSWNFKQGFFIL